MSSSKQRVFVKNIAFKTTLLATSLALVLSGCQSVSTYQGASSQNPSSQGSSAHLFGEESVLAFQRFDQKADTQAKSLLLQALATYQQQDRTLRTVYYQKEEPLALADFEKNSDPVAMTLIKLINFSPKNAHNKFAHRKKSDYLNAETKNLPLLRYYDEQANNQPPVTVSRQEGMEGNYATSFEEIKSLDLNYHNCVVSHSLGADRLIDRKPNITNEDAEYKNITQDYESCVSEVNELADEIKNGVTATYQLQDIANLQMCVTNYGRDMHSVLSPNRNAKYRSFSATNGSMDYYSQVYQNYLVCNGLYVNDSKNDPNYYISESLTPTLMDMNVRMYQCVGDFRRDYDELVQQGKTQAEHAEEFLGLQFKVHDCFGNGFNATYGSNQERRTPTNLEEVDDYYEEIMRSMADYETTLYAEEDSEHDYEDDRGGFLRRGFERYFEMKESEQQNGEIESTDFGSLQGIYMNRFGGFLKNLQETKAQIQAKNWYQYQPSRIQVISHHVPSKRQFGQIVSFEYQSPTASQFIKVPYLADFNQGTVRADVSAGMPFLALLGEKYALLPSDFGASSTKDDDFGVMNFHLPKELEGVIPTAVIYDSLNGAMNRAFAEINPQAFSVTVTDNDDFARSVGASQVVRVNLNAKEQGELLANIAKILAADLSAYVDANADKYVDGTKLGESALSSKLSPREIKEMIDEWAVVNQGFLSRDIGGLAQAIEGILPLSFYQTNYYYLNQSGQLVGQVGKISVDSPMTNSVFHGLKETRIASQADVLEMNALMNATAKDGNLWLQDVKNQSTHEEDAEKLREGYFDSQKVKRHEAEQQYKLGQ